MKQIFSLLSAMLLLSANVSAVSIPQNSAPLFEASFLQGWYCRDWQPARWQTEMQEMKDAGFRAVILQSAVDLTYEYSKSEKPKTDPAAYDLTAAYALFPTALVPDSEGQRALEYALEAAKLSGMQVWIGTVSDDRWWQYGWGRPDAGFAEWSAQNGEQCASVVQEIWTQYSRYAEQIAGFYYNNEIWNIDTACSGDDRAEYAEILGLNIRKTLDAIEAVCPEKPVMISPFFNRDLSSAAEYGAFWRAIADAAGFRETDIFAHQDGGGRGYDADTISEWTEALRLAVGGRMRFWVNNETFGADSAAMPLNTLRRNFLAAACAERHILFSWNHYYHGKSDAAFAQLITSMTGDLSGDGHCTAEDAILLMHWLLAEQEIPANWLAGDLDANGILNSADLSLLMRRMNQT